MYVSVLNDADASDDDFPLHDALRTLNLVGCITVPRRLKNYRIIDYRPQ